MKKQEYTYLVVLGNTFDFNMKFQSISAKFSTTKKNLHKTPEIHNFSIPQLKISYYSWPWKNKSWIPYFFRYSILPTNPVSKHFTDIYDIFTKYVHNIKPIICSLRKRKYTQIRVKFWIIMKNNDSSCRYLLITLIAFKHVLLRLLAMSGCLNEWFLHSGS